MKYVVTVAGKAFDVVLNGGEVAVNDRQVSAELVAVPQTPLRELVLDGKTRKYAMTPESDGWSVMAGGEIIVVQVDGDQPVLQSLEHVETIAGHIAVTRVVAETQVIGIVC